MYTSEDDCKIKSINLESFYNLQNMFYIISVISQDCRHNLANWNIIASHISFMNRILTNTKGTHSIVLSTIWPSSVFAQYTYGASNHIQSHLQSLKWLL